MICHSHISDVHCTPPEIALQAAKIVDSIIPEKSKVGYEKYIRNLWIGVQRIQ